MREALETMCRRCTNYEMCQGTGCNPKNVLSELVEKQMLIKEKINEVIAELDELNETVSADYKTTSDTYFAGAVCAFEIARMTVSDGLDVTDWSDEE